MKSLGLYRIMAEGISIEYRFSEQKQSFFIDCLLEEDSLKKYSEIDKMSIFLLTFFIKKTNQDLDVINKANECLIKFFTSNPASL